MAGMEIKVRRIILGSGSPRRKEILEQVGIEFEISKACGEEIINRSLPWEVVEELSNQKALEVAQRFVSKADNDEIIVIGADTIVAFGNTIMGKPKDKEDAVRMIQMLQGQTHQVYTGVTIILLNKTGRVTTSFYEKTDVLMYPMSLSEIEAYVETGEPLDKAGAYAIQGKCARYIKGINGDYYNVVGLPVARLLHEIEALCD